MTRLPSPFTGLWTLDFGVFISQELVRYLCDFVTIVSGMVPGTYCKAVEDMCVCLLLQDLVHSCARGGGG